MVPDINEEYKTIRNDLWYNFTAADRLQISQGELVGDRVEVTAEQGTLFQYRNGLRTLSFTYKDKKPESIAYLYDARERLQKGNKLEESVLGSATFDGFVRYWDGAGRDVFYKRGVLVDLDAKPLHDFAQALRSDTSASLGVMRPKGRKAAVEEDVSEQIETSWLHGRISERVVNKGNGKHEERSGYDYNTAGNISNIALHVQEHGTHQPPLDKHYVNHYVDGDSQQIGRAHV